MMTAKQKLFADEYLIDLNATRAYKAAYPYTKNDNVARAAGARLLANVNVQHYIQQELEKRHNEKVADAQEVMIYLTSVLRGESSAEIVVVEGNGDGCSTAKRIKKGPDEKERLRAAELIGKRYRMFTENVNLDGGFQINFVGEDDLKE